MAACAAVVAIIAGVAVLTGLLIWVENLQARIAALETLVSRPRRYPSARCDDNTQPARIIALRHWRFRRGWTPPGRKRARHTGRAPN